MTRSSKDEELTCKLKEAIRDGHINAVREALEQGADLNTPYNKYGTTPLIGAILNNHPDIALLLIDKGANVNDEGKATLLTQAIIHKQMGVVRRLVEKGAPIRDGYEPGNKPLDWAATVSHTTGNTEIEDFLKGELDRRKKALIHKSIALQKDLRRPKLRLKTPSR